MAILLSMKSRSYHTDYIKKLEDTLFEKKQEVEILSMKLDKLIRMQSHQQSSLVHVPKGSDEYGYLRVLNEQSEKKIKALENELVTLHMKNLHDNNALTEAEQILYHFQDDMDSMKIENMKLKQELQQLTKKPPDETIIAVKQKTVIEILPGYDVSSETIEKVSKPQHKEEYNDDIIPGELLLVDGEFREVRPPRKSIKAILRNWNKAKNVEPTPVLEESDEFAPEIKYLTDNPVENNSENITRPSYARCNLSSTKKKNDQNCAQQ